MPNSGKLKVTTPSDCEIVMTRSFQAPRERVWMAMTRPELLRQWMFLPPGWTMATCQDDLRVGGAFLWAWAGPDSQTAMTMRGTYREVVPMERMVRTESFEMGNGPPMGEQLVTLSLVESGGVTHLTLHLQYASKQDRDGALRSGMEHGVAAGYDQLEAMFANKQITDCDTSKAGPMPRGVRPMGQFCWINMLTPQPDKAREFFAAVLGWTYTEMPGMGHSIQVDGHDIGGLFDLNGPQTPPGTPPCIGVMIKVDSADATCAKVTANGGKCNPPFDIMEAGRMAVCFDPNGANVDVWEPHRMKGTEVDAAQHGAPSWFETITTDTHRAREFYCQVFGWTAVTKPTPGLEYTIFTQRDAHVAGMMGRLPHMGNCPAHWGVYFTVNDADAAAHIARQHGGKITVPLQDIPGIGRFCGITSPQGVMFYVMRYLPVSP